MSFSYAEREKQAKEIYNLGMEMVKTTPEPEGQKYPKGTRVKISDTLPPYMQFFERGKNATVLYTHAHAYGGNDVKDYCIDIDGSGPVSWYNEDQLTPLGEGEA